MNPLLLLLGLALILIPAGLPGAEGDTPPVPLELVEPVYPVLQSLRGKSGYVRVEFVIGPDGRVVSARALESSAAGFEAAAVAAVKQWKFLPGIRGGRPVFVRASQLLEFNLVATRQAYPYAQLQAGKSGSATIGYWVDAQGQLTRTLVVQTTEREFGGLAEAMLAQEHERHEQRAEPGMSRVTYRFDPKDPSLQSARAILKDLSGAPASVATPEELDEPLVPKARAPAKFPVNLQGKVDQGRAEVEFFVDARGNVQLARTLSATRDEFGFAAVQALTQWTFGVPRRAGKPVVVRVREAVEFGAAAGPLSQENPR